MSCFSESPLFGFPLNSTEYSQKDYESEKTAAAKALENIHLIYNEIMTPKNNSEESEIFNYNVDEDLESLDCSCNRQNQYLKTCCNTFKKLCVKCDKYITKCASCNQCKCSVLKNNIIKVNNETIDNTSRPCTPRRPRSAQENYFKVKCTVPKPFSFNAKIEEHQKAKEYKIGKLKEELEKEIENELKIRANLKPVPKTTRLPLYNKMVKEQEKHKVERKEKCIEMLNSTKPFNLQTSKNTTKAKSSSDLTSERVSNFKAKPAPKHILSNEMSEKLKNKEEVRKMLIIERAKHIKDQSTSPFSQRSIPYSRSLINLLNLNKTNDKDEPKSKNISEITKRLYAKKCNETMDNWNKKVSLVDTSKKTTNQENENIFVKESLHKKQLAKKENLPFMYFPVRMSNAAILREKQIRADILARKEREKRKKEEEFGKKKINTEIVSKLRDLIPSPEGEREIDEKIKMFRESQMRRKMEYEKELEEIMKRVAEQNLLLERQSKIKQTSPRKFSDKESEADSSEQGTIQSSRSVSDKGSEASSDEQENVQADSKEDSYTES